MEILQFIFSEWWLALTTAFFVIYIMEWVKSIIESFFDYRNISKHGYPNNFLTKDKFQNNEDKDKTSE